jgi:hypothetical protein
MSFLGVNLFCVSVCNLVKLEENPFYADTVISYTGLNSSPILESGLATMDWIASPFIMILAGKT